MRQTAADKRIKIWSGLEIYPKNSPVTAKTIISVQGTFRALSGYEHVSI